MTSSLFNNSNTMYIATFRFVLKDLKTFVSEISLVSADIFAIPVLYLLLR